MELDGLMPNGPDVPEVELDLAEQSVSAEFQPDARWQADFKRRLLDAYDELFGGRS